MDLSTFYTQFRDETAENLRVLGAGLLSIESDELPPAGRRSQIDEIFRAMHTIKGSARMLGFEGVSQVAHVCEHILGAVRDGRREFDRSLADDLLRAGDSIQELIAAQLEGRPAPFDIVQLTATLGRRGRVDPPNPTLPPAESPTPPPPSDSARSFRVGQRQTVRVRVDRLDRLLNLAGELTITRHVQQNQLEGLEQLQALVSRQQQAVVALTRELATLRFSPTQRAQIDARLKLVQTVSVESMGLINGQREQFAQHTVEALRLIDDLEQEVIAIRLLPASTLFANLPRAVREVAAASGKEVQLRMQGESTELDRKAIEALSDPIMHMIRNAVDHGIEQPDERELADKSRSGTIEVIAQSSGAYAQIVIRDDGRGMDPAMLRENAVRKKLLTREAAERLSDQEALELVFLPGFSTAAMITDISGRGVGMDVVRTNVLEIGGRVVIESVVGIGTSITLALPLTLVTTRVLLLELGEHTFAVPANGCLATLWVDPSEVRTIEGRAVLVYENRLAPLLRLADLLDVGGAQPFPMNRRAPAIVIGSPQRPIVLVTDRLLDEREAVVKPLGPLMAGQRRYSGALQTADGRLALVLNPNVLVQISGSMALAAPVGRVERGERHRLLVADDSFTTRELIRSILQAAGYEVLTAVDGEDALRQIRATPVDLVVSDVEMPHLDGFALTAQIRAELAERAPPVIIVTSLASDGDRRRGLEVGAQAYIVKSQFNQGSLLEAVQQLLGS